tara:strand:- start:6963 stop:7109 length:147 start_codon:yes stop_codon:yes gene_type:complete
VKTLTHLIYSAIIIGIILVASAMSVIEDEMRLELSCKTFLLEMYGEKL